MASEPLLADARWDIQWDTAGRVASAHRVLLSTNLVWELVVTRVNIDRGHAVITLNGHSVDLRSNLPWDAAVGTVLRWAANLDAGRRYNQHPRRINNFYADRAWSQLGARLHLLLLPGVAPDLVDRFGPVLRGWSHVLRVVPARNVHVTLAWLPAPTAAHLSDAHRQAVRDAFQIQLARLPALAELTDVELGPAKVTSHSVRCELLPPPGADLVQRYATAATQAMHGVFGAATVAAPRPDPHLALAYGTAHADATDLHLELQRVWPATGVTLQSGSRIVLTDADTFAEDPWAWTNTITLAED